VDIDYIERARHRASNVIDGTVRPTLQNAKDVIALVEAIYIQARQIKGLMDQLEAIKPKEAVRPSDVPDFLSGLFGKR